MRLLNVETVEKLSNDIYEVFLVKDGVDYTVGNCLALYGPDGKTSRPYSFASSPKESFYSFIIKRFENGYVSTYLTTLSQGDRVQASNPYGFFTPGKYPKSVFVSTGTGIAPFVSSIRHHNVPPIKMYYGSRTGNDVARIDFFEKNNIDIEYCLSKPVGDEDFTYSNNYVTDSLERDFENYDEDTHFYLCGLDTMIIDTIQLLTRKGIPLDKIHHECFFNKED